MADVQSQGNAIVKEIQLIKRLNNVFHSSSRTASIHVESKHIPEVHLIMLLLSAMCLLTLSLLSNFQGKYWGGGKKGFFIFISFHCVIYHALLLVNLRSRSGNTSREKQFNA